MRILVATVLLSCAALSGCIEDARADAVGQAVGLVSTSVTCPPFNLYNPDAGSGVNGLLNCSTGYRAVRAESEVTTPYYACGVSGCTKANYATVGLKRCSTCTYGGAFNVDVNYGQARCISGTADAGVVVAVMCGK